MSTDRKSMGSSNNDTLGAEIILSSVGIEDALATLIEAEALKVTAAKKIASDLNSLEALDALAQLNNSVANVLGQISSIKNEINNNVQTGLTLRGF
jgi:division protein CdvB (Snf7/Vps24/ESCRT-III family)